MHKYQVKTYDGEAYAIEVICADSFGVSESGILRFFTKNKSTDIFGRNSATYSNGQWVWVKEVTGNE